MELPDGRRVGDERQAQPAVDDFFDGRVHDVGQIAQDGEDDESGEERGQGVGDGDDDGVPVEVVGESVVRRKVDDGAATHSQREKGLGHRRVPNLWCARE